jgi:hypothetical protein
VLRVAGATRGIAAELTREERRARRVGDPLRLVRAVEQHLVGRRADHQRDLARRAAPHRLEREHRQHPPVEDGREEHPRRVGPLRQALGLRHEQALDRELAQARRAGGTEAELAEELLAAARGLVGADHPRAGGTLEDRAAEGAARARHREQRRDAPRAGGLAEDTTTASSRRARRRAS